MSVTTHSIDLMVSSRPSEHLGARFLQHQTEGQSALRDFTKTKILPCELPSVNGQCPSLKSLLLLKGRLIERLPNLLQDGSVLLTG